MTHSTEFAKLAQEIRAWGASNSGDHRVYRLCEIEKQIPFLSSPITLRKERVSLMHDLAAERQTMIFSSVVRSPTPTAEMTALEQKVAKMKQLMQAQSRDSKGWESKRTFEALPNDMKALLYWAVWVQAGTPMESQCGERRLSQDLSILTNKTLPILYQKGGSLCEQALAHYENLLAVENQKHTFFLLIEIAEMLSNPMVNLQEVRDRFHKLPHEIQNSMCKCLLEHRPQFNGNWDSARNHILQNPNVLFSLRLRDKEGPNIIWQHLNEQHELSQKLEKAKHLEEFERLTLLCKKATGPQLHAVLGGVSPKARELFSSIEKESIRKAELRGDPNYLYQWRGAHLMENGTRFQVFAPNARKVELVLTAFGNEEHAIPMHGSVTGVWEAFSEHARLGRTYRYRITDAENHVICRTDPFSFSISETNGIAESVVCDIDAYQWRDESWMKKRAESRPLHQPLSIYELNVDYWKKDNGRQLNFQELAHHIVEHQRKVPFTHVELYGVLDNRHDYSWGYQPNHFLAPNRRMGGIDGFKYLVDHLHQNGIGVVLDWVPAHFKHQHAGDCSQTLHNYDGTNLFSADESPWETAYFDYSKEETRRLMMASALFWLEQTHVDGFRIDAVSPMVCRNGEVKTHAVSFLQDVNRIAHEKYPGILMIAEETDGFPNVTKPVTDGGLGFDAKMGVHMQHKMRSYFRTPHHHRRDQHNKLIENLREAGRHDRWMLSHTHDEAAEGNSQRFSSLYSSIPTDDPWRKFADMRVFHAWNLLSPGAGHMFHMGDEIGQVWAWNHRLDAKEGAVEWHLLENPSPETHFHRGLQEYVGDLHRLYRSKPAFWKHADWGFKLISDHADNRVIGFHRLDYEGGRLALFFNFSTEGYQQYDFPLSHQDPELRKVNGAKEIFNSDGVQYGGSGKFRNTMAHVVRNGDGTPTHYRIALPPLSVVVFEEN